MKRDHDMYTNHLMSESTSFRVWMEIDQPVDPKPSKTIFCSYIAFNKLLLKQSFKKKASF